MALVRSRQSPPDPPIGRWVGAQDEQAILSFDVTGDLHRFRNEVKYLLIYRLARGGDQQQITGGAVFLTDKQNGRDAAANASDRAGAMRQELARIHHAKETFAIHNFAHEGLAPAGDGCGRPGGHGSGRSLNGFRHGLDHRLVAAKKSA
jgi:hypothetical protein